MDPTRHANLEPSGRTRDAERVLIAAVAAQQVELQEEEARLAQRQHEWRQREELLAAQLEDRQRELAELAQRALAQRAALEPAPDQQQLSARERELELAAAALARRDQRLHEAETLQRQQRARLNGDLLKGRHELKEAWHELRRARFRWKHRRGNERAALRVRAHELEAAAGQLAAVRKQLQREQAAWASQRQTLESELDGLNQRVLNERQLLLVHPTPVGPDALTRASRASASGSAPMPEELADLAALAGALADQRLLLVDTWERLTILHARRDEERVAVAAELEILGRDQLEQDLDLQARAQAAAQTEIALRERHDELVQLQRQLIAWRARLRSDEETWEHDKNRLLAELHHKEALANKHSAALTELRRRWQRRRQHELGELRSEQQALETFRREFAKLRQELAESGAQLDDEKRIWTEKALALEQHRQEMITESSNPPLTERRLARLRRRWITQNAAVLRALGRQRSALKQELRALEARYELVQQRSATLAAAEDALAEKQAAWEEKHLSEGAGQLRLVHALHNADTQRALAQQQALALRDEVERIARDLLDEPDPPQVTPLAA